MGELGQCWGHDVEREDRVNKSEEVTITTQALEATYSGLFTDRNYSR